MNKQAVYEKVRNHLLTQNAKARPSKAHSGCYYRAVGDGGVVLKCAIGVLIPDSFYSEGLESCTVDNPVKNNAKILRTILTTVIDDLDPDPNGSDVVFLRNLQRVHDGSDPPDWPDVLREFAKQNGLVP